MILLLAGTGEARQLAQAIAAKGLPAVAALAGVTRTPDPLALSTRIGGWGSAKGFAAFLHAEGIGRVIDATHPFAARITARTAAVCRAEGVAYLRVQRPPWRPAAGDIWHEVEDYDALAGLIPRGARVLAVTGRGSAQALLPLAQGRHILLRVIDPGPVPEGLHAQVARPPLSVEHEIETLRNNRIDWLVVKNAGGQGGRAKLDAARALGLPVAMLARPELPQNVQVVKTVGAALDWLG